VAISAGVAVAVAIRLALLPTEGFRPDLDQFVLWVHDVATAPLGETYRQNLSFPPVMVYVFAALAAAEPAFRTTVAGSDPWIRTLMKAPATLADLGLAACVAYALRERPRWAATAALAILLNPAVWYLSAWWGQFESIYVLPAAVAYLLAVSGRPVPAAVALGVSLMTKPQALPFLVPFAAWIVGRYGIRTGLAAGLTLVATVALLWLPFAADGGPVDYLRNLGQYQGGVFSVLSLRAWNLWWLVQQAAGGGFASDAGRLVGPITFRLMGYALAGLGELLVFVAVLRRPTTRALALGLACATLVAFAFLTTMHERYAFAAIVFLAPLLPAPRIRWLWLALTITITANLVSAIPATAALGTALPATGALGVAGAVTMLALTAACLALLLREPPASRRLTIGTGVSSLANPA
jgi:hypothetical protein